MQSIEHTISKIKDYAAAAGIDPATVCRKATGNPRLFERMIRRAEQIEADVKRLEDFMAEHPISTEAAK